MSRTYPTSPRNKVRQLSRKASYDRETVAAILRAGLVAQVGFVQDGRPVVVPMIYGLEGDTVYLHGARKARVVRLLEKSTTACLNVTLVDAIVLARSAFNSSMNYRSVTVFGSPRLLEDADEKLHAMRIISEHTMPGRWSELRDPYAREVTMTGVIAMTIETASAKISSGMPDDEPEDYEIPVWAGILPLASTLGALQDDGRVRDGVQPSAALLSMQHRSL
ncbi:MAG TPA: pyridoxamine 5'-phosphate oxidase family protein [Woeseiaceae bacterium]|nr:pyridoxamine 5'-phosphate oxidase family protein [Woeseiaceae bacterium]